MKMSYLKMLTIFLLQLYFVAGNIDDIAATQLNDDVLGLIVFKSGVIDPFSRLSTWNEDDDKPCAWDHVTCDPSTGRAAELRLDGLGLSGRVGKGLRKLQGLRVLSLSGNNFTGDISPEKLSLPTDSLKVLNLSRNNLSGQIPEGFINASIILDLDLSENRLSGNLPESLFSDCIFYSSSSSSSSSSSLRSVSLGGNLLEGPIPRVVTQCASLTSLNLSSNRFTGNPNFLGVSETWMLGRIRTLDLSVNFLSGPIPRGVSNLHYMKYISVRGNQFSGKIPSDIGLCPHLTVVDFAKNQFSGELPDSLRRLTSLSLFAAENNLLTGILPRWIGELENLEKLDLSGNTFTGKIPTTIGGMKSLISLSLSNNKLSGTLPSSLGDCSKLSIIRLNGNILNGTLPESLFDLALEEADFSGNNISGQIPAGSSKLFESLRRLDISMNGIEGDIPAEMGLFSNLEYLNLSWNKLQSEIPPEIGLFRNLTVLDLRKSGFYGEIPGEICDSGSLNVLQLDGNRLVGSIPSEIGNCSSLSLLTLSHNNLSGSIPKSISKISKLKILRLESNQLSGEIPKELGEMRNLLAVNVSFNRLVGRLPSGSAFQSLDQSSLQGNLGICSPLLKGPCKLNVPKPLVLDPNAYPNDPRRRHSGNDDENDDDDRRKSPKTILSVSTMIAISAAVLIVVGVLIVTLLNASARKKLAFVEEALESMCSSSTRSGNPIAGPAIGKLVLFDSTSTRPRPVVDHADFLNKASEIGEGSIGTVYKVSLDGGRGEGEVVAMKKIANPLPQRIGDFDREVRCLARAKHPNLASLKGYYFTPKVQVLVSEYVSNGSLESKIHSSEPLTWAARFKIMVGTAKGLAHLHHSLRPSIVHYNLKPNNVLLDPGLSPKLTDFGLAGGGLTERFVRSGLGYAAPELACRGMRVDEKCDVYSFGALTLELVTGRRPVEYGEDSVVITSDHARALLEEGKALECVDRSIGDFPEDEVLPVLKLALVCTSHLPSARPSMAEVVHILQVIKTPVSHRMDLMF